MAAVGREDWDEFEQLFAADVFVESRRKIVGFTQADLPSSEWPREARRLLEIGRRGTETWSSQCAASGWPSPDWSSALQT